MTRGVSRGSIRGQSVDAQCTGKVPFDSGALAYRTAKRMASKKKGGLAVYRCPHCGKYHIGGHHEAADL